MYVFWGNAMIFFKSTYDKLVTARVLPSPIIVLFNHDAKNSDRGYAGLYLIYCSQVGLLRKYMFVIAWIFRLIYLSSIIKKLTVRRWHICWRHNVNALHRF
jgi:hypothetical protein